MKFNQSRTSSHALKLEHIKKILEDSQEFTGDTYSVFKSELEIDVYKNVFSPGYFDDSEYFANNLQNVEGLSVLEIGTGTGLIALKFALGNAKQVIATDINPAAIKNARHNINKYQLQSMIELRQGYIFQPVKDEKFDFIFWNIPFGYLDVDIKKEVNLNTRINELQKSVFNPYYNLFHDYLNEGFDHLTTNGKLQLGFSPTIGREEILEDIITDLNLEKIVVKNDIIEMKGDITILQILEFKKRPNN